MQNGYRWTTWMTHAIAVVSIVAVPRPPEARAQAFTWDRLEAQLVISMGDDVTGPPAPPIGPGYSERIDSDYDSDDGTVTRLLAAEVSNSTLHGLICINPDGEDSFKFYGGENTNGDLPALMYGGYTTSSEDVQVSKGIWHHDNDDIYTLASGTTDCYGCWKLLGTANTTADVVGRLEYDYLSDADNASWFNYHSGGYRIARRDAQGDPTSQDIVLDAWHSGFTAEYDYWEWQSWGSGFPPFAMGNTYYHSFSPYGGSFAVDTFAPSGVPVNDVMELIPSSGSSFVVIPSVEHISTTAEDLSTGNATGFVDVEWSLVFTATGPF